MVGKTVFDEMGKQKFNDFSTTDWNIPETLEKWRESWADLVNAEFEKHGLDCRVDHRSYADQGIELIPQIHEGPNVRKMEAKGIITGKGELNHWIKEINKGIVSLSNQLKDILSNIAELINLITEKEEEARQPDLTDYIYSYFEMRNKVADTFSHGRNKAKIRNLKKQAEVLTYLTANKITSLEDFNNLIADKQDSIYELNQSMKEKSARTKELKDMLRYGQWYREAQPVIREICSTKSKRHKEQIKSDNEAVLLRYHIAKRILFDEKELDSLQDSYREEYASYKKLTAETKTLRDINRYMDDSVRSTRPKVKEVQER